ncbi:hypothetical protein GCM10009818_30510 [Nakamurella flavida]
MASGTSASQTWCTVAAAHPTAAGRARRRKICRRSERPGGTGRSFPPGGAGAGRGEHTVARQPDIARSDTARSDIAPSAGGTGPAPPGQRLRCINQKK